MDGEGLCGGEGGAGRNEKCMCAVRGFLSNFVDPGFPSLKFPQESVGAIIEVLERGKRNFWHHWLRRAEVSYWARYDRYDKYDRGL